MNTENQELTNEQKAVLENLYNVSKKMLLVISLLFVTATIKGIALKALWYWFITTPFNLPPINLALSIGLIILINYCFTQRSQTKKSVKKLNNQLSVEYVLKEIKNAILKFLVVISIGYSLHFFI